MCVSVSVVVCVPDAFFHTAYTFDVVVAPVHVIVTVLVTLVLLVPVDQPTKVYPLFVLVAGTFAVILEILPLYAQFCVTAVPFTVGEGDTVKLWRYVGESTQPISDIISSAYLYDTINHTIGIVYTPSIRSEGLYQYGFILQNAN